MENQYKGNLLSTYIEMEEVELNQPLVETILSPTTFKWALETALYKDTIFAKKKTTELVNVRKIYGFIKDKLGINYGGIGRYKHLPYLTELDQITKFKELYDAKLDRFKTTHSLPKHRWGRIKPAEHLSLSVFHRPTRHSLCEEFYIDVDMKNAQPQMINEICKMNDITNTYWIKYVKNPKKYRELIMKHHNCSKDVAKQLPIVLTFGGSYLSWIKDNLIDTNEENLLRDIVEMGNEMKAVIEIVYLSNQHIKKAVLKQDPKKWTTESEAKRGVMALWGQSVERIIQETAISYLVEKKNFIIEDIVPSQDGFMILKELDYPALTTEIDKVVLERFNIKIEFIRKPFDEAQEIKEYDGLIIDVNEFEDLLSEKKLADRFIEHYTDYIVKNGDKIFVYYDKRWIDETDKDNRHNLTKMISEDLHLLLFKDITNAINLKNEEKEKLFKILRTKTSKGSCIKDIIIHIVSTAKSSVEEFDTNPFKLGFNNGVYDLIKGEFREYEYSDYMTMTTKYDYKPLDKTNEDNIRLIEELKILIESIHPDPENRKLYLQILASGLDGIAYQNLFLFNGEGGNGKGLTGKLMNKLLGEYFSQPSNSILKDFEKSNCASPDLFSLKNKRYVCFTEVGGKIRVAMLRKLTGGDKFSARQLYKGLEDFNLTATFVMEFNTPPELDGKPIQADYRRLFDVAFPVNFTENPDLIDKEIGGVMYKKANKYYTTEEFLMNMRPIFLDLLLETYKENQDKQNGKNGILFTISTSVRKRTDLFMENQNIFQKVFNREWEKVEIKPNDKADEKLKTVQVKLLWNSCENSEEHRGLTFRVRNDQYSRDDFYKWCESKFKVEGNTKTGKIIKGIQRKSNEDGLDAPDEEEEVYEEV